MFLGLLMLSQLCAHACVPDTIIPHKGYANAWRMLEGRWAKKVVMKMAYATKQNFMKKKIYPCAKCYLRPEAMTALQRAIDTAAKRGYKLVIYDCYRPRKYQYIMYKIVKNEDYVANPKRGSMHNRGLAVDIGLADSNGVVLDCGSAFDDFSTKAHFWYSDCSAAAQKNKAALRSIMQSCGFSPYDKEWWHFSYKAVSYEVDEFIWPCQ
ncbi:MAG: hypothetical protein RL660_1549 [Bacteroidota bacterium]